MKSTLLQTIKYFFNRKWITAFTVAEKKAATPKDSINSLRRHVVGGILAGGGLALVGHSKSTQAAEDAGDKHNEEPQELRFPGDPADHKVVYQFNKGDETYQNAVLFSVGAMLRKYGDNIHIVVVGIGPGIHILAKRPKRPVSKEIRERVASLLQYGVEFHACGNTMKSLGWTENDVLESAKVVEVGAADLMELQEQGYSYLSW
jgi:intracellular sulfur oxidation DsrE/DsrF family protein